MYVALPGSVVFLHSGVPPPLVVGTALQSESRTHGSPSAPAGVVPTHAPEVHVCELEQLAQVAPFFPHSVSSCRKVEMQLPR